MSDWKASGRYGAAVFHIGGRNRGCAQPQLTASWVDTQLGGLEADRPVRRRPASLPDQRQPRADHRVHAASLGTSDGADAVAQAEPIVPDMPDILWYARCDGGNTTTTRFPFASGPRTGHRRGHQYQVDSTETYGGAKPTVDRDAWDAPVADVG